MVLETEAQIQKYNSENNYDNMLKEMVYEHFRGRLWKGPEPATVEKVVLPPRRSGMIGVKIDYETMAFLKDMPLQILDYIPVSVRSRYAQAGLDIGVALGSSYHSYKDPLTDRFRGFQGDRSDTAYVMAWNRSLRPMEINEGSHVFRYYYIDHMALMYRDYELIELYKNRDFQIKDYEGNDLPYGENWNFVFGGNPRMPVGVAMKVMDEDRFTIKEGDKPFSLSDTNRNYRDEIMSLSRRIKKDANTGIFFNNAEYVVGHTPRLTLSDNVESELGFMTYHYVNGKLEPYLGKHINSRLIDAGSDWPIKVEIMGPITSEDDWVIFRFYKKNNLVLPGDKKFVIPTQAR